MNVFLQMNVFDKWLYFIDEFMLSMNVLYTWMNICIDERIDERNHVHVMNTCLDERNHVHVHPCLEYRRVSTCVHSQPHSLCVNLFIDTHAESLWTQVFAWSLECAGFCDLDRERARLLRGQFGRHARPLGDSPRESAPPAASRQQVPLPPHHGPCPSLSLSFFCLSFLFLRGYDGDTGSQALGVLSVAGSFLSV